MASKRRNMFYENKKQETTEIEEECREERDWLETAGLSGLTDKAFLEGREVTAQELERAVAVLSREQAAAVRRRVDTVNKTLRQRHRHLRRFRNRKPDIREVFREVERGCALVVHTGTTGVRPRRPAIAEDMYEKCFRIPSERLFGVSLRHYFVIGSTVYEQRLLHYFVCSPTKRFGTEVAAKALP
ncbi:hypothetical protein AAG570_005961 [Ranatra chinensis]|uniref:Uncharacterized protein n=1 Tax=Ranatra chinensis TaxID=642074 RepID=A0ABD0XWN2_9HEMI